MPDIIHLLPDAVANQIAAGEVVQRPASVVKELLENAVDAGATEIKLIIKEGGSAFIQVSDNGSGMTETDARMCFERHATSKIQHSDDLFRIHTKGFRGEALASIAAVSKMNLKTCRQGESYGIQVEVEASKVVLHEPCSCPQGSIFTVKSLFYNVPARRKFLKSEAVETRHIMDEFHRVALAHPEVAFEMTNNGTQVYALQAGSFRQRIIAIFGNQYQERLVPVEEEDTDLVKIRGFIVKPDFSRKTRGEQFFIVNDRFIKSPYLHHAMSEAFEDLLPKDAHPGYFLCLEIDPAKIDINIHPTKTEIKFEEEKYIYAILKSAARKALGKYNITPVLNFDQEPAFAFSPIKSLKDVKNPSIDVNPHYNPFHSHSPKKQEGYQPPSYDEWIQETQETKQIAIFNPGEEGEEIFHFFQWENRYIITHAHSGLMVIDQHRAHERVLFERFLEAWNEQKASTQMELFPQTIEFSQPDFQLISGLMEDLTGMGFDMEIFGTSAILVRGIPVDAVGQDIPALLEGITEQFKKVASLEKAARVEHLAKILAARSAIRPGVVLNKVEVRQLVHDLFQCRMPMIAPNGKPVILTIDRDELDQKFLKS